MIGRITSTHLLAQSQRNLQSALAELGRLQEQASSQRRISRPSDDPAGTGEALRVRSAQRALAQHSRNIADGSGWLATVDSALGTSSGLLQRARALVLQGGNDGVMSTDSREAIAVELETIRDDLLKQANTSYNGRFVFAGTSDAPAFDAAYAYSGTPGSAVERRIADDRTIRVDADGAAAFGTGAASVFATLDTVVTELRAGASVGPRVDDIDAALKAVLAEQSVSGTRYTQMERAKEAALERSVSLEADRTRIEDVDLAEVVLRLQSQEVAYRSALAVTGRALPPTLLSFLA